MSFDNVSRHNCGVYWIEQDGVRLPRRVGGHPALDFCNTWAGWGERSDVDADRREWLSSYDVLVSWCSYAELLDDETSATLRHRAARRHGDAADVLERARTLRAGVHDSVLDPADASALAVVTEEVRRAGAVARVVPDADGAGGSATWSLGPEAGLELPVLAAAWSAAQLLTSPEVAKVCACPGVDCGWLFVDGRGRRRWCDMAVCGNRAKVAAHARRAKAGHGGRST